MKWLAGIALCLLGAVTSAAGAQVQSVSYSTWSISGNMVTLTFVLPVEEAQHLMGVEVPVLTTQKLKEYLLQNLTVKSAGGECPAIDQGFDLGRIDPRAVGQGLYGFEILYRCTDPRQLVLHNAALFARTPQHVNFARIQTRGASSELVFTAQHQEVALLDDHPPAPAGWLTYSRLGMLHIVRSMDRWVFLLGLLVLLRRRPQIVYLLASLAVGYALSWGVAAAGWVVPRAPLLEAFVGLLVGLLGVAIIQREARHSRRVVVAWPALLLVVGVVLAMVRDPWAALTVWGGALLSAGYLLLARRDEPNANVWPFLGGVFAFLDGFAMPSLLAPAQLAQPELARMVVGFDLGALLVAALLIAVAIGAWLLIRRARIIAPRALFNDVCAAALSGAGTFWMLNQLR